MKTTEAGSGCRGTFKGKSGVWMCGLCQLCPIAYNYDNQQIFAVKPLPSHITFLGGGRGLCVTMQGK